MFNARATGLTALLFFMAMPAFADPPRDIDALVSRAMQLSGVPGMAMAIVEHGQVTLARGYGVRRLGSADSVDADTIFEIGSVSKAFTAAALAVLVDRGKIRWDDPVINHITGFQMYDPWVTREITVLDLLVPGGEVQRISMRAVSPRADFSWDYPDLDFRPARK